MRSAEVSLPGQSQSASSARRFLAERLTEWELGQFVDTTTLLASELVANAVLHARTELVVRLIELPDGARLEVADYSPRAPFQRRYEVDATTGRGLGLVASLSESWGVETDGAGKTVWCVVTTESMNREVEPDLDAFADVTDFDDLLAGEADTGDAASAVSPRGCAADHACSARAA